MDTTIRMNTIKYCKRFATKANGFTLIEVLVASVILFASLGVVSLIYKGAFLSSEKAISHIELSNVTPIVINNIQNVIRSEENLNNSEIKGLGNSWNTQYTWKATLLEFDSAPPLYDVDNSEYVTSPEKYKLWEVHVELKKGSISKNYIYNEVSWNDQ